MKKTLTILATLALVAAISIGGTLAYLTAKTDAVTNTFTFGNMSLTLDETYEKDSKIYPGAKIAKTPVVSVGAKSEPCYVYAKIDNGFGTYAKLDISDDWSLVSGTTNIYRYKDVVDNSASDTAEALTALFTTVTIDGESVTTENIEDVAGSKIVIDAFAYQANGTADTDAAAQGLADTAAIGHWA